VFELFTLEGSSPIEIHRCLGNMCDDGTTDVSRWVYFKSGE